MYLSCGRPQPSVSATRGNGKTAKCEFVVVDSTLRRRVATGRHSGGRAAVYASGRCCMSKRERGGETELMAVERGRELMVAAKHRTSSSAAAGVVMVSCALAGITLFRIRPRDPIFEVLSITLKGFKFRFCTDSPLLLAVIDAELILSIKVTNPNVLPIEYTSTIMDIFYHGDLLGQAKVEEGSQGANSQEVLEVPAKLDGLEMTNHLTQLLSDVRKREMTLHSVVTIKGNTRLWKWTHPFEVYVSSNIKVDPIFLDILEQENNVHMELAPII